LLSFSGGEPCFGSKKKCRAAAHLAILAGSKIDILIRRSRFGGSLLLPADKHKKESCVLYFERRTTYEKTFKYIRGCRENTAYMQHGANVYSGEWPRVKPFGVTAA
jgi:hypothetical protein